MRRRRKPKLKCAKCGGLFDKPNHGRAKFCSAACRQAAYVDRRANERGRHLALVHLAEHDAEEKRRKEQTRGWVKQFLCEVATRLPEHDIRTKDDVLRVLQEVLSPEPGKSPSRTRPELVYKNDA